MKLLTFIFAFTGISILDGLGSAAYPHHHESGGDIATMLLGDMPVDRDSGMSTNDMGDGPMMRPDMSAPVGVMGGMSPKGGKLMLAVRHMRMRMEGNRDGTDEVSTAEVLSRFPVTPLNMDMEMLTASPMYGITDDISVMAMVPYLRKAMDHVTRTGVAFTTRSEGLGDVKLALNVSPLRFGNHTVQFQAGLSFPTGSIEKRDDTPARRDDPLPYPMQIGSGTYDLLPGIVYTGRSGDYSWGAQFAAVVRLGKNERDYRFGDIYRGSAWGSRKWTSWLSSSLRLEGESEQNIDGADSRLNPLLVPTADPNLRGGERINLGLGLNFLVPSGPLRGTGLSVELMLPIFQNLDGPQLERDYNLVASLRESF